MEQLEINYMNFLPVNRKERYYTATILPQIICYQNFKFIDLFFSLIKNFPNNIEVFADSLNNNIQFITEFSIKESANFLGKKFDIVPPTKDTPDLVILITKPDLYLIVVEGKMFSSTQIVKFKEQIEAQKKIIECIKENLGIKSQNIFHIALLPRNYFSKNITIDCQMIFWEDVVNSYYNILKNNYFYETLRLALKNYKILVAKNKSSFGSFGKNMEDKLSGLEILELHNSGSKFWVGRNQGLKGALLEVDKNTGGWKTFKYEVNFKEGEAPNIRNWFSSQDFVNFIGNDISKIEDKNEKFNPDPWHFTYLGKDYFLRVAEILGFESKLDCPIKSIYTGKSNVEYREKLKGRKVNPNWCVILENGRQYKYGTPTRNQLKEGLWKLGNCKRNNWSDIKNYNWQNS